MLHPRGSSCTGFAYPGANFLDTPSGSSQGFRVVTQLFVSGSLARGLTGGWVSLSRDAERLSSLNLW